MLLIIEKIILIDSIKEVNLSNYAFLRERMVRFRFHDSLKPLYNELQTEIGFIDSSLFLRTPADDTWQAYRKGGLARAYSFLDLSYRNEKGKRRNKDENKMDLLILQGLLGFVGYYLPRLPYSIYKVLKEN